MFLNVLTRPRFTGDCCGEEKVAISRKLFSWLRDVLNKRQDVILLIGFGESDDSDEFWRSSMMEGVPQWKFHHGTKQRTNRDSLIERT